MRYSFLFVAVLILISGFIAYFGDVIGRRLGKKRLTVGSLRPRHTAYIITAITGMLISGMAVATLVSVNSQFRKVFTEGERILAQNESLTKANDELLVLNNRLRDRSKRLQSLVNSLQLEAQRARKEAEKAKAERDKQLRLVKHLQQEVASRTREVLERKKQLEKLERAVASLNTDIALARADLRVKTLELDKVQEQLRNARDQLIVANSKLADAENKLKSTQARLEDTRAKLAETESTLRQQEIVLKQQKEQIELGQAALVREGIKRLQFEKASEYFAAQAGELRSGDLILRQGDEIVRGIISPRQSMFGIRADLMLLLDEAGERVEKIGASKGSNGRAVNLIFRQMLNKKQVLVIDNESVNIPKAAETIASSPIDVLVQVVCAANTIRGEQVPVEIMLYLNKLVYRKGDIIAHTEMDGRVSEGRILLAMIKFLREDVSKAGLEKGIIPISNPDSRINIKVNPLTQIEGLMTVVDQIRSKRSRVSVDVYADKDIYAEGPLNMDNMRFSVAKI
jgi:uncharacterized protein (DUF3084 family)